MTRRYGKLLGFFAGAALVRFNPLLGALVGLLLGHAFDADWFRDAAGTSSRGQDRRPDARYDPYRVLGLSPAASDSDLDFAYRRLIARYHPDKVAGAGADVREEAEQRSREINAAYDRIAKSRRR